MIDPTSPGRLDGRPPDALRPISITPHFQRQALGSALILLGHTRVLCAVTRATSLPDWLKGSGRGWVTAEYAMLPASTDQRVPRRPSGRATEIQRLVGRSLRSAIDLAQIEGLTLTVDCDVIDADGGTRTASITGAWVALYLACQRLVETGVLPAIPLIGQVAAVSVGLVNGRCLLDLDYHEDQQATVDMNVVGTETGRLIEIQGTAEGQPFERAQLDEMLDLALTGIRRLVQAQRIALGMA